MIKMTQNKKSKYERRRAIDCKLLKKSTTHKNMVYVGANINAECTIG